MAAKQKKSKSYWDRKYEAIRNFGTAESRSQENFRTYLLEKRKLNLGFRTIENSQEEAIESFSVEINDLPSPSSVNLEVMPFKDEKWNLIDQIDSFNQMGKTIIKLPEITLDVEENQDHSYNGMICLLQIGTLSTTYLVDPFPLYSDIKKKLKKVMESPKIVKIMHGCVNDVHALKRDFDINLVAVIDVQLVHRQMMKTALETTTNSETSSIFDDDGVIARASGLSKNNPPTDEDLHFLKKHSGELISLKRLTQIYYPGYPDPVDATLADWRIRPLSNQNMIDYAVYDAHVLIGLWQKMKKIILSCPVYKPALRAAIKETNALLKKTITLRKQVTLEDETKKLSKTIRIDESTQELLGALNEFRNLHAKLIDEPVGEVMTLMDMITFLKEKPDSSDKLVEILKKRRPVPECYESWKKPVLRIINEGVSFWNTIKERRECHVCQGRLDYPHMAWGCVEPYSQEAVNRFMRKPENQAYQEKEYNRRLKTGEQNMATYLAHT